MRLGAWWWCLFVCTVITPQALLAEEKKTATKNENVELRRIKELRQLDDSTSSFDFFETRKETQEEDYEKSLLRALQILDKTENEQAESKEAKSNQRVENTKNKDKEKSLKEVFEDNNLDYDEIFDEEPMDEDLLELEALERELWEERD